MVRPFSGCIMSISVWCMQKDPGASSTHVSAVAGCYLPWQWARWEREQLLCVRVLRAGAPLEPRTAWSAGFQVHAPRTLTLACRYGLFTSSGLMTLQPSSPSVNSRMV